MAKDKKKILNKEQLEAIRHGKGPLLIIAGAGTGKTTVITERIKYLISKKLAEPSEILALTFTDKAAREMEERIDAIMPYGYTQMWISTFHSFGDRVLRDEAVHIGLDPGFRLMTEAEATQFLRKNLFLFNLNYFRPLGNPTKFIRGMRQHFSRLQDEDINPEDYLEYAKTLKLPPNRPDPPDFPDEEIAKTLELAHAYKTYFQLKAKEGLMDFADLITNTLQLFRKRPNVLKQYQDQFKFILVDEFQDTNIAQNELAILLASKGKNITVTGDDDQSIYRFRGSSVSNIIQFRKRFPKTKVVVLTKNYRSTQEILDRAYLLIKHNNPDRLEVKEKISKELIGMEKIPGEKTKFLYADRVENEAELVAKEIENCKLKIVNLQYKDIAILVRANSHADAFIRALTRAGIPYQFLGPGQLFRQPKVKDLIAYLKILHNFEDSVAMYRILGMDHWDVSGRDLAAINNFAKRLNLSLFEACEHIAQGAKLKAQSYSSKLKTTNINISDKTKESIVKIVDMVHRHLGLIPKETAGQILYYFLEDSGLLQKMTEIKSVTEERQTQNISKFFDKLKTYEVDHEDASVQAVCDWIELAMELGESPLAADLDWTENNAVNILTVHSSKGLEFPVVFLVNLVATRFPSLHRREQIPIPESLIKEVLPEGDYHLQEERRLFYVGITRAQNRLYLTASNFYGEGKREKKLSPFVLETLGEKVTELQSGKGTEDHQLSIFDWGKPPEQKESRVTSRISPITYLSYSQISTFDTCPLQYRYRYLQKIPVPPSAAASFGQAIHSALCAFYQLVKKNLKPNKNELLKLLDNNWIPLGYSSKAHETRMKKEGRKMLADFYEKAYDSKIVPKNLEQMFTIRITPTFKVGGRIDRVDEYPDGSLEIIDYKTGKIMDVKQVDKSLQMTVYALAAADPGIYKKEPENVILSFYFLSTGEKISTKRTKKQLIDAEQELLEKKKEIETSSFEPKPGIMCDFCDFRMICEAWQ